MHVGPVSATAARELARLPRGNQGEVGRAVHDHEMTNRQAGELCSLYLGAQNGDMSKDALREVLADPLQLVRRQAPTSPPTAKGPRLSEAGEQIRRWLVRFDQAAASASHCSPTWAAAAHSLFSFPLSLLLLNCPRADGSHLATRTR